MRDNKYPSFDFLCYTYTKIGEVMTNKKQVHKIHPEQYLTVSSEEQQTGSGRGGRREGAGRKKGQKIKEDFELKKSRSIRMTA